MIRGEKPPLIMLILLALAVVIPARAPGFDFSDQIFGGGGTLSANIQSLDTSTGMVIINGVETQPISGPFTWDWGDGLSSAGYFPQSHTYTDKTRNYIATCTSHYPDGSTDTVQVLVYFVAPVITPTHIPDFLKVTIPSTDITLGTRLYTPPTVGHFADTHFGLIPRSDLEYVMSVAAKVQYDFLNADVFKPGGTFNQVVLRDAGLGGGGMYSLWYTTPVAFGAGSDAMQGDIPYSSFFHEMGHNFSLNTPNHFYYGGRIDGNANAIYSETLAQIIQHSTAYVILNDVSGYGLSFEIAAAIEASAISAINLVVSTYNGYVSGGKPYSSWNNPATAGDETFSTFMTLAFKFVEHAELAGNGYRMPMKRMMQFLQIFDPGMHAAYDQHNNSASGNEFRSTLLVTAISYAFNSDLRSEFTDLNFPIDDAFYEELWSRAEFAALPRRLNIPLIKAAIEAKAEQTNN